MATKSSQGMAPPAAAATAAPPAKRRRKAFVWRATLPTPQTFRTLLNIVQPTVAHVPFQVCVGTDESPFTGLCMDAINDSRVCMVKTAYECMVELGPDADTTMKETFCVETDTFITLMRDVQASHVVELVRYIDDADLTIHTYERADSNTWSISTIQMVDEDPNTEVLDLTSLKFDYVVEIELERLKEVCRIVHAIRGTMVEFMVEELAVQTGDERHHYFTIAANHEGATTKKIHHSSTVHDGGPDTIKVVRGNQMGMDDDDATCGERVECFKGVFPVFYLNGVLKSMDRQTVQIHLSKDPRFPMVLHYGMGNDTSYIRIILAPRVGDV